MGGKAIGQRVTGLLEISASITAGVVPRQGVKQVVGPAHVAQSPRALVSLCVCGVQGLRALTSACLGGRAGRLFTLNKWCCAVVADERSSMVSLFQLDPSTSLQPDDTGAVHCEAGR